MAYLQLMGNNREIRFDLTSESVVIGRSPDCGVVLQTTLGSRHHARIVRTADGYVIEDLKSLNGTFVNGAHITTPTKLFRNDVIQIGDVQLTFHSAPQSQAALARVQFVPTEEETTFHVLSTQTVSGDPVGTEVNPEQKLRAVLELTRDLGSTLDLDTLLTRMLDSLFRMFTQAD